MALPAVHVAHLTAGQRSPRSARHSAKLARPAGQTYTRFVRCSSTPGRICSCAHDELMKHVTYANKSLFIDDEASDLLTEYAAVLGSHGEADTVKVRGVSDDGNNVEATFVLNSSSDLMVESTNSQMKAPDNEEAVAYMRDAILRVMSPAEAQPDDDPGQPGAARFVDDF